MKLNVVAIVQARMGSTRMPGKILMELEGKPVLWHIFERLKHAKKIGKIVLATTDNKSDDSVEEFLSRLAKVSKLSVE